LPPHDLAINGIGDADVARSVLAASEKVLAQSKAPVLSRVGSVLGTTRSNNAQRL
jgi:hypothetical protein